MEKGTGGDGVITQHLALVEGTAQDRAKNLKIVTPVSLRNLLWPNLTLNISL